MDVFFLVGAAQALFFVVLIFSKQSKTDADRILGFWLLVMGIQLIIPFIIFRNPEKYYNLGGADASLFPLWAIFMFLYTKTVTASNSRLNRRWLYHLLVLIVLNLAFLPYYLLGPEEKLKMVHKEEVIGPMLIVGVIINFLTFASYIVATLILLQRHKKKIRFEFSYEKSIDLKWLRNLIYSLVIIGIIFLALIAFLFTREIHVYDADAYFYLIEVVFIFGIGYWGFKQGTIFPYKESGAPSPVNINIHRKKRKEVPKEEQLVKELHDYMHSEKPFLAPTLSLYDLASSMNWSTHELSALLNKHMETNFYEYVNNYRVEEVKKRLKQNNQKFTVLAIAFDCGFNSKASFNRIFKEKTGITPSDFVRNNQ